MNELENNNVLTVPDEYKKEKHYVSKVMLALFLGCIMSQIVVSGIVYIVLVLFPKVADSDWFLMGFNSLLPVITIAFFLAFSPKGGKQKHPVTANLTFKGTVRFLFIFCGIVFTGAIAGEAVSSILSSVIGSELTNAVEEIVGSVDFLPMFVSVVIMAPIFEELLFRKVLIDRLSKYGTVFCVVVSGLTFGLFHGNFYQFFYTFGIGSLLAFIYCIYGKISYAIIGHALINFFGSVVSLFVVDLAEYSQYIMGVYAVIYLAAAVIGIWFLICDIKWFRLYLSEGVVNKPFRLLVNFGFGCFILLSVISFVISMF